MDQPVNPADWLARRRRLDSLLRLQAAVMGGDPALPEAVRLLADSLGDPDDDIRELAAAALSEFGPDAQIALPELINATTDASPIVRRRAIRAIGYIGPIAADDSLHALISATEDSDDGVALQALATLGEFGPLAVPALPALMSAIWAGDVRRRALAGAAVLRLGDAAVPYLIPSLAHPSADVRAKAAQILGRLGSAAAPAVPHLKTLDHDADEAVRTAAAAAITTIG